MSGSQEQHDTKKDEAQDYIKNMIQQSKTMTPEQLQFDYKGILYPTVLCSEASFQALESLEAREDDVFIVTYPKCGTNWSIQILYEMMLAVHGKEPSRDRGMLEFGKPEKYENLKQEPSPRILATHLTYENIPKSFYEKSKILFIVRNPKDTAVSYYHFNNTNPVLPTYSSWDLYFKDFMSGNIIYGSYFDYLLGFEKHMDDMKILVLTFEDMKNDFPAEIRKVADFYGFNITDEQIQQVQQKTSFTSMKDNSANTHGNIGNSFFRKGEIGDWKSLFTEEQSKEVDAKFEETLAGTKMGAKINYAKYCTF